MRSHTVRAGVAIGLLLCTFGAVARAQDPVTDLRVSLSQDGTKVWQAYPIGTEVLYAVFNYTGLDNARVTVVVEGRGITDLYATSQRFSGSGTASVELSGASFYKSLTARFVREIQEAQSNINRASTSTYGLREYFQQALGSVYTADAVLDYVEDVPINAAQVDSVVRAGAAMAELRPLLEEAIRIPEGDVAACQAKAEQMKKPASAVLVVARSLDQASATLSRAAIAESPEVGDASARRREEYTVSALINGSVSSTTDFSINPDTRIFLSKVVRNRR